MKLLYNRLPILNTSIWPLPPQQHKDAITNFPFSLDIWVLPKAGDNIPNCFSLKAPKSCGGPWVTHLIIMKEL